MTNTSPNPRLRRRHLGHRRQSLDVGFSVRHMMVSKVRGYFRDSPASSSPPPTRRSPRSTATIDMDSIDTRQERARRPHQVRRLLRRGQPHRDDLPLDRRARQGRGLAPRGRADPQGHHQARHPGARAQRLRPGRLRRDARRLHRHDASPAPSSASTSTCRWTAAASSSATRSTSSSRSRPCCSRADLELTSVRRRSGAAAPRHDSGGTVVGVEGGGHRRGRR